MDGISCSPQYCTISISSNTLSRCDRKTHFEHSNTFLFWTKNVQKGKFSGANGHFRPDLSLVTRYIGKIFDPNKGLVTRYVRTDRNSTVLQLITDQARSTNHPGRNHVVTLRDSFELASAHGRHLCFVHEAMGRFTGLFQPGRKLPILLVKDVAKQMLQALDFLHRECRIVHTGATPNYLLMHCL